MRYVMKEKLFDFGDDFVIRDEDGREAFHVDGRVLAIGDKLVFKDREGRELARIEKKLLSWGTTYEIYRGGRHAATVRKSLFSFLRCTFTVDVPGPGDLEARGDFLDHEYTFTRGDDVVAQVSKKWFSWRDTYGIDIREGEDEVLLLACAVVVERACHDKEDGHD